MTDFAPTFVEDTPKYDHGYTEEQVFRIRAERERLYRDKVSKGIPLSLQEEQEVIIPFIRIHRTEVFILNDKPEKVKKIREPKEKKAKEIREPKVKKLTKKQISDRLSEIAMAMYQRSLSEEEQLFFETHTKKLG